MTIEQERRLTLYTWIFAGVVGTLIEMALRFSV